jgi:hypothetical protein
LLDHADGGRWIVIARRPQIEAPLHFPAARAGANPRMGENPMKLELEVLAVDSFETTNAEPTPAPVNVDAENVLTCLQTNCGKFLCCA